MNKRQQKEKKSKSNHISISTFYLTYLFLFLESIFYHIQSPMYALSELPIAGKMSGY